MTEPKVCILTETYYPVVGGGETQARLLAEGLTSSGLPVIVVTRRSDDSLSKTEVIGPVTVYRLSPVGRGQLKKWGLAFTAVPALIRLRRQYDVLFVSGFRIIGATAVLIGKLFGKPCVLKADSQGEMSGEFFRAGLGAFGLSWAWRPFRVLLRLRNLVLRRAEAFVAITSGGARELTDGGVAVDAVRMIPNSVDTALFCPVTEREKIALRQKLQIPHASRVFVYTGRLVSYKGLPLLLRAWKAIQSRQSNVMLLLVGTGGLDIDNCETDLRQYVSSNDLGRTVRFTGEAQNVHEYLQASDAFVLPTENDAFPSSLVEAMSCGLPVITTPVGAISTIVTTGANGILVSAGSCQQVQDAMEKLIVDANLASRLGESARAAVCEKYSAETVSRSYIDLFREVTPAYAGRELEAKPSS